MTTHRLMIKGTREECERALVDRGYTRWRYLRAYVFSDGEKHEFAVPGVREEDLERWFDQAHAEPLPAGTLLLYHLLAAVALGLLFIGCSEPTCGPESVGPCPTGYFCSTYHGECRMFSVTDAGQRSDAGSPCDAILDGNCYVLLDGAASWPEAVAWCGSLGGHLMTIGSDAEQQIAWEVGSRTGTNVWIGATDEGSEGSWRWGTGEPFLARWATSPIPQPDNAFGGQHCAHLWPEAGGLWADVSCDSEFPSLCEVP